ncbi:MAG: serine/threonine protein kinase [Candidatus Xenobia bacterium]
MLQTGEILENRYRVDQEIGHGGMGGVYLGTHLQLGVRVAIKQLALDVPPGVDPEAVVRQFQNEARMLHNLHHPQLPRVHDFFASNGSHYLVMDYIEGRNLNEILTAEGVQAEAQVLQWARALCDVLEYLHSQSPPIIFRDLKPSNVMLDTRGQIRLIDFGIAKEFDVRTGHGTMTMARGAISPGFAAPEQYGSGTDSRSDIYSLGATLYVLFTHRLPPQSVELAAGAAELIPLQQLRPDLTLRTVQAIEWMMQVKAGERPQSIQQVREALGLRPQTGELMPRPETTTRVEGYAAPTQPGGVANDRTIPVHAAAPSTLPKPQQPRQMLPIVGGVAALLIVLIGLAIGRTLMHSDPVTAPPAASAQLTVTSQPSGATVYLSDKMVGKTPMVVPGLLPLTYEVRFELAGYRPERQVVNLDKGEKGTVQVTLQPAPATLRLSANVVGTVIEMDGQQAAVTGPLEASVDVPAGKHKLAFSHDGYLTEHREVAVKGGQTLKLSVQLKKQVAAPVVSVPQPTPVVEHTVVLEPKSSPTMPPSPQSSVSSASVHPGVGLGPVTLGMSLDAVSSVMGTRPTRIRSTRLYAFGNLGTVWLGGRGNVLMIASWLQTLHTDQGIGVGSRRSDVERQYGSPDGSVDHQRATDVAYNNLGLGFRYEREVVTLVVVFHPRALRNFRGWGPVGNAERRQPFPGQRPGWRRPR